MLRRLRPHGIGRRRAPNASLSGLRLLGAGTDSNEAAAMTGSLDTIDIYSPAGGQLTTEKRSRQGHFFRSSRLWCRQRTVVWNDLFRREGMSNSKDNSNYDGWANSRYVNAIAAIGDDGRYSDYSEPGAHTLIARHLMAEDKQSLRPILKEVLVIHPGITPAALEEHLQLAHYSLVLLPLYWKPIPTSPGVMCNT